MAKKDVDVLVERDYYKGIEDLTKGAALKGKSAVGDLADGTKARIPLNQYEE